MNHSFLKFYNFLRFDQCLVQNITGCGSSGFTGGGRGFDP